MNAYIESRKMVLMNFFQGCNGDGDIENRFINTGGREGKERVRRMERVA